MEQRQAEQVRAAPREGRESSRGPAIELRHLRYFLTVSEELHFRRAAERLHIAQPPLSHAIRRLEEELGVRLLERTSRTVTLTEAGRVFTEEARKVLACLDVAVAEARRAGGVGSTLRIGCTPFLPIERLLGFLDALHEREPQVRPEVTHLVAVEQIRRIERGDLDLGLFPGVGRHPKLQSVPVYPGEALAAYLRPDHPLAAEPVLGPEHLENESLVVFDRTLNPALWDLLREQLSQGGFRFVSMKESGTTPREWILAVAAGAGIALLANSALEVADAGTIVVRRPIKPVVRLPDIVLAWRTRPPTQLRTLLEDVRALAVDLHEQAHAE
jgi:DNA-binding transcriptional LysR family regulator